MAGVVTLLAVGLQVEPGLAQLATITFPDTSVGSASTITCPTNSVSLCFGSNCSGSGTVQSVSGPSLPFKIGKLNLISQSQFNTGACEANPVGLPVSIGPGQVLAYQATFTPTSAGSFSGSATFSTGGGPATVNFNGKGVSSGPKRTDKGFVGLQLSSDRVVPGSAVAIQYRTKPGNLQGPIDLYFIVGFPAGDLLFVNEQGGVTTQIQPLRRNVSVSDTTETLFSGPVPVGAAFGAYNFYMAMVYAGATPDPSNLPPILASSLSQVTLTNAPLSAEQQALLDSRGRPDLLTVLWVDAVDQKTEAWLYLSNPPTRFRFLNGTLQAQEAAPDVTPGVGPKFDPAVFTPQLTPAGLQATFGPPTSVEALDSGFVVHHYASGLDVVFRNGALSSANTFVP